MTTRPELEAAVTNIQSELTEQTALLRSQGKLLEAQRLEQRTRFDLEMMREMGFCHGIENYSRHFSGRKPGESKPEPQTLLKMYKEPARPDSVSPIGRYAISFRWNDGHQSGIYSWDYLRRHCLCAHCGP